MAQSENVRVLRQLELLFVLAFEDFDPGRWRGSCKLTVEDFQEVKLCTCNLLNCPRCVQRRCVMGLAPGEESCDCRWQVGKWARVPRLLCPPGIRFDEHINCGTTGKLPVRLSVYRQLVFEESVKLQVRRKYPERPSKLLHRGKRK